MHAIAEMPEAILIKILYGSVDTHTFEWMKEDNGIKEDGRNAIPQSGRRKHNG
jgi:hypothetical protein